ncbi:MAG TPA: class I tRNA ligase family protein, partial [Candidatus Woesebacteria bacterium]|nr:class I tRNA ligase family protein [Candidatus Woesebacteria bacterium]
KYNIPVVKVIESEKDLPFTEEGTVVNSELINGLQTLEAKEKIIQIIEKRNIGKGKTTYRLRDWLVSRQRYWGAPIPIVYDPEGNPHPVEESDLPVLLPYDVNFKPTGESPLKYSDEFHNSAEQKYGKGWRREVDTMDTFVDSSWYFFRHLSAKDDKQAFDTKEANTWLPTDLYMIGAEHIVLHLLYSRFFTKFFYDQQMIDFDEPFYKMRHMGTILGPDGRKMSKRWGNIINPTDVVQEYGADTLRIYEMFMGPLDQSKPWDAKNVHGAYRFLNRIWGMSHNNITQHVHEENKEVVIKLQKTIKKVTEDTPELKFNTAIASMMEFINEWENKKITVEHAKDFLKLLAPYAPFFAEEIWRTVFNEKQSIHLSSWPQANESLLIEETIILPVQVNGKVRGTIQISAKEEDQEQIISVVKQDEKIYKYFEAKEYKVVYIPKRILNIIVK